MAIGPVPRPGGTVRNPGHPTGQSKPPAVCPSCGSRMFMDDIDYETAGPKSAQHAASNQGSSDPDSFGWIRFQLSFTFNPIEFGFAGPNAIVFDDNDGTDIMAVPTYETWDLLMSGGDVTSGSGNDISDVWAFDLR
jgi:hypothetical protein